MPDLPIIALIIAGFLLERYISNEQHRKEKQQLLDELSRATKAIISKNANEYVMTTSIDKVVPEEKKVEEDVQTQTDELNEEDFDKMIERQNA